MDSLSNSQIKEQIALLEIKIANWKEKIRAELKIRKSLKEQLMEAKKREATQILILERLCEYEEIITKQLEAAEKMEDSESIKQLAIINQYKKMIKEQQEVWAKYEEEYEQLPLAQERKKAEHRLMKVIIQTNLAKYKLAEIEKMERMKEKIRKKQEQQEIIKFAELYVQHIKRQERCAQLVAKVNALREEERDLRQQVEEAKRQFEEDKRPVVPVKKSITSRQLPKIDMSHYIIRRDNNNCDTVSMNSYILEQEYMTTEEPSNQPDKQPRNETSFVGDLAEDTVDPDSEPMDVSSQEKTKEPKGSGESQNKSSAKKIHDLMLDVDGKLTFNHKATSQESQSELQQIEGRGTPKKRIANQRNSSQEEEMPSRRSVLVESSSPYRTYERPVPSPAKMHKQAVESPQKDQQRQAHQQQFQVHQQQLQYQAQAQQQQQQQTSSPRNVYDGILSMEDVSKIAQSNKTLFQTDVNMEHTPMMRHDQPTVFQSTPRLSPKETDQVAPSTSKNVQGMHCQSPTPQQLQQLQHQYQQHQGMTTPMCSMDGTIFNPDNMSINRSIFAGSDISEAGGSLGLVDRLYKNPDLISEDGEMNVDIMNMGDLSPIAPRSSYEQAVQEPQPPQPQRNEISQASVRSLNSNIPLSDTQEQNNSKGFSLMGYVKKPTKNMQSLF